MERMMRLLAVLGFVALLLPHPALAYLEPGAGSLFLQSLIAAVAGLLVAITMGWRRLIERIRNGRKNSAQKRDEGK